MPHFLADAVYDSGLNLMKNNVNKIMLCQGQPATFSEANTNLGNGSGKKIGEVVVDSSDFTLADDALDGRRLTVAAQSSVAISVEGNLTYLAWVDTVNSILYKASPLQSAINGLTTLSLVNIPSHFHRFRDATEVA